jgi:hypothetical protein
MTQKPKTHQHNFKIQLRKDGIKMSLTEKSAYLKGLADGLEYDKTTKEGKIIITAYVGKEKVVSIPDEIGGCPVTYIADAAFENNHVVEKVIFPKTVAGIGWFAFRGCIALCEIEIPSSVSKIEYGAFDNCNAKLTFVCPVGSYAEEYAQSYGFATKKREG